MADDTKGKVGKGLFWAGIDNFGIQALTLIFSVILMRSLEPSDFGIVGQALAFVGFSRIFIDAGFGASLIQIKNLDDEYLSTVFWINLIIGVLLFGVFYFVAPLIANFYEEEKLVLIVRVLSLGFIVAALNVVQRTILQRNINFKKLGLINLTSFTSASILAVTLAWLGYKEWSLVLLYISNFAFAAILLQTFSSFRPKISQFNYTKLKEMLSFSMDVLGYRILNVFSTKFDRIIIGKYLGDAALGIYENAHKIFIKSVIGLALVFEKVLFPAFSKMQDEKERLAKQLIQIIDLISLYLYPFFIIGAFLAEPIILGLFGEKWIEMIPIFQVFCLVSFFLSINPLLVTAVLAVKESRLVLNFNIFNKVTLVFVVLYAVKWGIVGVAIAWSANVAISCLLRILIFTKKLDIKAFDIFRVLLKNIAINIPLVIGLTALFYTEIYQSTNSYIQILIGLVLGISIMLFMLLSFRKPAFMVLLNQLKKVNQKIS